MLFSFLFITAFLGLVSLLAQTESRHDSQDETNTTIDHEASQRLLDQVDSSALHAASQHYSFQKSKHEVYHEDCSALETGHRENARISTSMFAMINRQETSNPSSLVIVAASSSTIVNPEEVSRTGSATPVPQFESLFSTVEGSSTKISTIPEASKSQSAKPVPRSESWSSIVEGSSTEISTSPEGSPTVTLTFASSPSSILSSVASKSQSAGSVFTTTKSAGVPELRKKGYGNSDIERETMADRSVDKDTHIGNSTILGGVAGAVGIAIAIIVGAL